MHITFLGGGNMASALIGGLLKQGTPAAAMTVIELDAAARERLRHTYGVNCVTEPSLLNGSLLVLAVKPQQMRSALQPLIPQLNDQIILSIAAGLRLDSLSRWLGGYRRIVRAMPNTPSLIGAGMTGLCAFPEVSVTERQAAEEIVRAVGQTLWVDQESCLDAITAISGSGPAYVFLFIEALQQAACDIGLDPVAARQLALHTFDGTARLATASEEDVSVLRQRVTSKGGTTEAALRTLQERGIQETITAAVRAANARSIELGVQLDTEEPA